MITQRTIKILTLISMVFVFSSCASILNTSVSEMNKGPGKRIEASDSQMGFIRLTIPQLDATGKLKAYCQGNLTGVQTTTTVRDFFLVQMYAQKVSAWCMAN